MGRKLAIYVVLAALMPIVFTACSQPTARRPAVDPSGKGAAGYNSPADEASVIKGGVDRRALEGAATRVSDMKAVTQRFAEITLPEKLLGQGISQRWLSKPGTTSTPFFEVEYQSGLDLLIKAYGNQEDALRDLRDADDDPTLGLYVRTVTIHGDEARVQPKLNIAPVWDEDNFAQPGTGIQTGANLVRWVEGRFLIELADPRAAFTTTAAAQAADLQELVAAAGQVDIRGHGSR